MFKVLMEYRHLDANPVRMVKGADESSGEREVYISFQDFNEIVSHLPQWVRPIAQTLYATGMRRGEALSMTWDNVDLDARIIRLQAHQTKERKKKRVPIHRSLVRVLKRIKAGKLRSISSRVFLTDRGKPPSPHSLRNPWRKAVKIVGLDPIPTLHDLRHVWATNAMRSGMDPRISETIMGHALKKKDVKHRYLHVSDEDLVRAINVMRFNKGATEIWIAGQNKSRKADDPTGKKWYPEGTLSRESRQSGKSVNCLFP
jgi:integrase